MSGSVSINQHFDHWRFPSKIQLFNNKIYEVNSRKLKLHIYKKYSSHITIYSQWILYMSIINRMSGIIRCCFFIGWLTYGFNSFIERERGTVCTMMKRRHSFIKFLLSSSVDWLHPFCFRISKLNWKLYGDKARWWSLILTSSHWKESRTQ